MKRTLGIIIAAILLSACGMEEGTVYGKIHQPERHYTQYNIALKIVQHKTDDEDWLVCIAKDDDRTCLNVSEATWNRVQIGDEVTCAQLDCWRDSE